MKRALLAGIAVALVLAVFLLFRGGSPIGAPASHDDSHAVAATPSSATSAPPESNRPKSVLPARPVVVRDSRAVSGGISGAVVNRNDGAGVEGAELGFEHDTQLHTVTSGPDGVFEFVPPKPGSYTLAVVTAEGFLPFAPAWGHSPIVFVTKVGERLSDVRVAITPAVHYTGFVRSPQGGAVVGAQVKLLGSQDSLVPLQDNFTSDGNGEFKFTARDGALLEATHRDWAPGRAEVDLSAQISHRLVITMKGRIGDRDRAIDGVIAGRVEDEAGQPIADVRVIASGPPDAETTTDADGRFTLRGLEAGLYDLVARAEGRAYATAPRVSTGRTDVVLKLTRGTRLVGVVSGDQGPMTAFVISVAQEKGPLEASTVATKSFFDSHGKYEIDGLSTGTYRVSALAAGYAPDVERGVSIDESRPELKQVDFQLHGGGSVTGVVTSAGGGPIAGAKVSAEGPINLGREAIADLGTTRTGEDGRFELGGLPPGRQSVLVAAGGHHARIISALNILPGQVTGPLDIEMRPLKPGEKPKLELVGIGAALRIDGETLRIMQVVPGGGAAQVGLQHGDQIVHVAGTSVVDLGFGGAIQQIRGPVGTSIQLGITKAKTEAVVVVDVPRMQIRH